jgi:hypothetical protein
MSPRPFRRPLMYWSEKEKETEKDEEKKKERQT